MTDLEVVLRKKIKPLIDESTEKHLGVSIDQLTVDITSRLSSPLIDIEVDTSLPYKQAKAKFKKGFLTRLLLLNLGNVSEVARITGQNRRNIHRLIKQLNINVKKIKKELIRPYDIKIGAINSIIGSTLDEYKTIVHPTRLREMYQNVSNLSEGILKELPEQTVSFQKAQREFELRYFRQILRENSNLMNAAKKIGLRYETLHRKLKALNLL